MEAAARVAVCPRRARCGWRGGAAHTPGRRWLRGRLAGWPSPSGVRERARGGTRSAALTKAGLVGGWSGQRAAKAGGTRSRCKAGNGGGRALQPCKPPVVGQGPAQGRSLPCSAAVVARPSPACPRVTISRLFVTDVSGEMACGGKPSQTGAAISETAYWLTSLQPVHARCEALGPIVGGSAAYVTHHAPVAAAA